MIISASRRTDIPAYYSEWLLNRFREGFVCVRNPVNRHQVSRVPLTPDVVDGIVFWTKNPIPLLGRLDELKAYMYYFQFTLNAYGKDAEPNVPGKNEALIPAFRQLARQIGPERVIWRYDPIFLSAKYTMDYHTRYFEEIARRLCGYTRKCVISFLDYYQNTAFHMKKLNVTPLGEAEMRELAKRIAEIARRYHMTVETCAENMDLSSLGIAHGCCVDGALFERLLGQKLDVARDENQRKACGCVSSIDIGEYSTCPNGCLYCYATENTGSAYGRMRLHDPQSPLLIGRPEEEDHVTDRKAESFKKCQISMFD